MGIKRRIMLNRCNCDNGRCGSSCDLADPCQSLTEVCLNGGICLESCTDVPDYRCNCTDGYAGKNCTEMVSRTPFFVVFSLLIWLINPLTLSLFK